MLIWSAMCRSSTTQLWIDASVRCPHAERYTVSASKPVVAAIAGETEKTKRHGTAVRSLVFETCGNGGRRTDSAARMLSADGGPSWSECCRLNKQTHTCERLDPEQRSGLLLSLCCGQSRACIVLFGGACIATLM